MTRTTLLALASRVEAATGADRELDAAISCALKFPDLCPAQPDDFDGKYGYSAGNIKCEHGFLMADRYSASLDAALTLVPSGWAWCLYSSGDEPGHVRLSKGASSNSVTADAASPALALAAAALRAITERMPE